MSLDDLAYPFIERGSDQGESISLGLTKREHAAIALRIPESGDPDLDAMIRKAQRRDLALTLFTGKASVHYECCEHLAMIQETMRLVDALLAALDATNGKDG